MDSTPRPSRDPRRATSRRAFISGATAVGGLLLASPLASSLAADETSAPAAPNDTIKTIRNLRSTHGNFTEREIPEEQLQTILQSSLRAANASNMQNYSIVVLRDRQVMKEVCGYRGSRTLVFFADNNRMMASARALGHTYAPDGATNFVTSLVDTTLAAQTAAIAARSLGIDYLLTNGVHRGDMDRLWKLLDLPPTHCFPVIALVLGYPTREPAHLKGRYDGPGMIHEGKYHLPTEEELADITRRYDDAATHLALNEGWKEDGHAHFFDWLFTQWIGRRPAGEPTQMLQLLKRSGYLEA